MKLANVQAQCLNALKETFTRDALQLKCFKVRKKPEMQHLKLFKGTVPVLEAEVSQAKVLNGEAEASEHHLDLRPSWLHEPPGCSRALTLS